MIPRILISACAAIILYFGSVHLELTFFLAGLGLVVLVSYVVLARVFWFSGPLIGVSVATLLYVAGLIFAFARP